MTEEQKWDGLIKLLQSYRDELHNVRSELSEVRYEQKRLADELVDISGKMKTAEQKLADIEKMKYMAMGGRAALVAAGGFAVWVVTHTIDFLRK